MPPVGKPQPIHRRAKTVLLLDPREERLLNMKRKHSKSSPFHPTVIKERLLAYLEMEADLHSKKMSHNKQPFDAAGEHKPQAVRQQDSLAIR